MCETFLNVFVCILIIDCTAATAGDGSTAWSTCQYYYVKWTTTLGCRPNKKSVKRQDLPCATNSAAASPTTGAQTTTHNI